MKETKQRKLKFDYMWVIIAISFLMVFVSLGFCSGSKTLYLTAITDALTLPRGAFSINDTFRFVTTTIVNLYFGKMVARFGTKKLICAGFLCLIVFTTISTFATNLIGFYIASIFLGIGLSWTSTTMVSTIINRWCQENKGTFTGAILAANGIGSAIGVQVLSPIIFQAGNPFAYRLSYQLVTLILIITLALVIVFYRERPKNAEIVPDAIKKKHKARGTGWVGMDFDDIKKKPYFYMVLLSIFLTGMGLHILSGVAVPHMYDVGLDVAYVALITSVSGILMTFSKFSVGFMYDRLGMRLSMNICYVCAFLSLFGLVFLANTPIGRFIAMARTVFGAIALPLETVMLPLFANDLFGNKHFDKVIGTFVSVNYAGYALGAPLGNFCYDVFGNYNVAFLIFGIMMVVVTISMQYALSCAHRDRNLIENTKIPQEQLNM